MNFKNVSLKEFILTGLASNYLVTEESLEKITKKIDPVSILLYSNMPNCQSQTL